MEKVTTNTIIDWLRERVENREPVSPSLWLESALKLNLLSTDDNDELFNLQRKVAEAKVEFMATMSAAQAKVCVEATDLYLQMQKKKAKIEQIEEFIRICKIQARLTESQYNK